MRNSFLPGTDRGLLAWARCFSSKISLDPAILGLSPAQASAFAALTEDYATKIIAVEPGIRSRTSTAEKNAARSALKAAAVPLVSIIRGQTAVTKAQKIDLGLTVPSQPSTQPVPHTAPSVSVRSVRGRTARIRLANVENFASRARPRGVDGAIIFAAVSDEEPASAADLTFIAITNRTSLKVQLPRSAAPGAQVWIVARWFNRKKQMGPVSNSACTNVQFGGVMRMAA